MEQIELLTLTLKSMCGIRTSPRPPGNRGGKNGYNTDNKPANNTTNTHINIIFFSQYTFRHKFRSNGK